MNRRKIAIVILVVLLVSAGTVVYWVFSHGFSAQAEPSALEKAMVRRMRRIAIPAGAGKLKNPEPVNDETMAEAREHFVAHCSVCHGTDGRGGTTFGRNMYPKVPDLTLADTQRLNDGELFYMISNGIRFSGMPAFGGEDSPQEIWHLVAFLRRLPQLSPEELKRMREMAGEAGDHEMDEKGGKSADQQSEPKAAEEKREGAGQGGGAAGKRKPSKPHTDKPGTKPHRH